MKEIRGIHHNSIQLYQDVHKYNRMQNELDAACSPAGDYAQTQGQPNPLKQGAPQSPDGEDCPSSSPASHGDQVPRLIKAADGPPSTCLDMALPSPAPSAGNFMLDRRPYGVDSMKE